MSWIPLYKEWASTIRNLVVECPSIVKGKVILPIELMLLPVNLMRGIVRGLMSRGIPIWSFVAPRVHEDSFDNAMADVEGDDQWGVILFVSLPLAGVLSTIGGDNVDYFMFTRILLLASFLVMVLLLTFLPIFLSLIYPLSDKIFCNSIYCSLSWPWSRRKSQYFALLHLLGGEVILASALRIPIDSISCRICVRDFLMSIKVSILLVRARGRFFYESLWYR